MTSGKIIDPISIMGQRCFVKAAAKIESIYIGNSISLQVKLYEAMVEEIELQNDKNLIQRPKADPIVTEEIISDEEEDEEDKEDEEESGIISSGSD